MATATRKPAPGRQRARHAKPADKPPASARRRVSRNDRGQLDYSGVAHNPDNIPLSTYDRMYQTDETVKASVDFQALGIYTALGSYQNPNKKALAYVQEMFSPDGARVSLGQVIDEMCQAFVFGFALGEMVLDFTGKHITLDTIVFLKQAGIEFLKETDKNSRNYGEPVSARQDGCTSDLIDLRKCLHIMHGSRNGNPYGESRLKPAFAPWMRKTTVDADWARALQRVGAPTPLGTMDDPDQAVTDPNGDLVAGLTAGDVMLSSLDSLQNSSSMVVKTGQTVTLLEPKSEIGPGFKLHDDQQNKKILRSGLIPSLLFEPTEIGSFALGSKHFETYLRSTRRSASEFQRIFLRQLIGPLLRWNFGPNVPIGSFVAQEMDEEELKLWAEILFSLTSSGYLNPRLQSDMDFARNKMGLPLVKVEDMPEPLPKSGGAGKDGLPGVAPDGQDDASAAPPRGGSRTPGTPQGRPVGSGANGNGRAN